MPQRQAAEMIGWAFRQIGIWGGIGLLLYAVVGYRLFAPAPDGVAANATQAAAPAARSAPASAVAPRAAPSGSPNAVSFRADRTGHVMLNAVVNGASTRFMVDTGATMVALTLQDAAAAGIGRGSLVFNRTVSTASGTARVAPVKLRELRIGQFSATDVPAAVVENLDVSLLGQSFLKRLDSYEMRNGVLTLYWN